MNREHAVWAGVAVALVCALSWRRDRYTPPKLPKVPAYVISMPGRPREAIRRRLLGAGVYPQFVDAVVGRDVKDRSRFSKKHKWDDHQIGCALSHMALWRTLKGPALIMEDDVIPAIDFASTMHVIVDSIDSTIDIVFLGHCYESERSEPWPSLPLLRKSVQPRCTHAYYVTPSGMAKLAQWAGRAVLEEPVDEHLGKLCKTGELRCLSVIPQIARQPWQKTLHPPGVDPGPPEGTPS